MFIIVGLGNPTPEYEGTRHNVGFEVIDALARKYNIDVDTKKHRAYIGKGMIEGQKVILAKPQTYMNLSGESVRSLLDYYKVDEEQELLVIYDDISLGVGQIRIRAKGSAGGHNGIKNIIAHLGGQVFPRIKVGVGEKPPKWDLADYVLGHFSKEEQEQMEEGYEHAVCAVKEIVTGNIEAAMNEYNRKRRKNKMMQAFIAPLAELAEYQEILQKRRKEKGILQIAGCVNSQKTHLMYALGDGFSYKIIVFSSEEKAQKAYEEYRFLDSGVLYYPARDLLFYHADIKGNYLMKQRMEVIRSMVTRQKNQEITVITTMDAFLDGLSPAEEIVSKRIQISSGDTVDLLSFRRDFPAWGMRGKYRLKDRDSLQCAAGSWIFFRLQKRFRCVWSSGAMR